MAENIRGDTRIGLGVAKTIPAECEAARICEACDGTTGSAIANAKSAPCSMASITQVEMALLRVMADIMGVDSVGWRSIVRDSMDRAGDSEITTTQWIERTLDAMSTRTYMMRHWGAQDHIRTKPCDITQK